MIDRYHFEYKGAMMKVYFRNSMGKELLIGEAYDDEGAYNIVKKFCDDRNFKIYYARRWVDKDNTNRRWMDVGSHTEFFIVEM